MSIGAIFEIVIIYFLIAVAAIGIIGALCYGFSLLLESSVNIYSGFDLFMTFVGWVLFLLCVGGMLLFAKALAVDGNLFHPSLWRVW